MARADEFLDTPEPAGNAFYDAVRKAINPLGGRITSTNGGRHNTGSEHYSGRALDVGMARETPEQQEAIKAQLQAAGYRVRDERTRPAGQRVWSGPHLHVSMQDAPPVQPQRAPATGGGSGGGGGTGGTSAEAFLSADAFLDSPGADVAAPRQDPVGIYRAARAEREFVPAAMPAAPTPAPAPSQERYRPGSFAGRTVNSLFGPILSDDTIRAIDGYQGFDPSTSTGIPQAPEFESGNLGDMALRSVVRVPEMAANLLDLGTNTGDALIRAAGGDPDKSLGLSLIRQGVGAVSDAAREPGRQADAAGFGGGSISAEQVLDAFDPRTELGLGDRLGTVARFIPETLVGSGADMAMAVGAPAAYLGGRTNEIAENRAQNDNRQNVDLGDLGAAAPAAAIETLLERFTTGRLLPGGGAGAAAGEGLGAALGRVAKETGLQAGSGAVEELAPYLAETLGTETGATGRDALGTALAGALAEGALGGGVAGAREVAGAVRPAPAPLAEPNTSAPAPSAVPRQGEAAPVVEAQAAPVEQGLPAVAQPSAPSVQPAQQETPSAAAVASPAPDMRAATAAIDRRLEALDTAAAEAIPEAEVSALTAERQQLDDLVREQDAARRDGLVQRPEARLSADERATADARRTEIASLLETQRAARSAADQALRLRTRLENTDGDAALYEVAREINPTLGTPQAEQFRTSPASAEAAGTVSDAPAAATPSVSKTGVPAPRTATPSVPTQTAAASSRTEPPVSGPVLSNVSDRGQNAPYAAPDRATTEASSADRTEPVENSDVLSNSLKAKAIVPPRAESQRETEARQTAIEDSGTAIADSPPKLTSLKNAVTDAERVAEGRDPIIRAARKGNRETVDEAVRAIRETPSLGRETAQRLAEGGPVELKDEAVLLVHKVDLRKRRDAAAERAQSLNVSEEARAIARKEYDAAVQQIDEVDQAASRVGTESGRLLQLRRRMIAEDFSLPALERKLQMVVNRPLKDEETAKLREMADKVADLQRRLDAAESQQASAQVADMLARLMKSSPGPRATLEQRRTAAIESRAALSALSGNRPQGSVAADRGDAGAARTALAERLGRGIVARLERAGILAFDDQSGGTWDGQQIRIGAVRPENAFGVLLHEVTHANGLDVLGEQGYERALRDLDALEAAGDPVALRAKRRAERSGEAGERLDDERLAYMVEEATNAERRGTTLSERAAGLVRRLMSAFRRWAATSPVWRALEAAKIPRPQLQPGDFVGFARAGLDRMVAQARQPVGSAEADRIRKLETELRTDYKTGIRNQRAFDEDADLGWKGVAAMDMDGLKKINDQLGHDAGDAVLRALANELAAAETTDARFYRLSGAGDEFAGRFKTQADADRMMAAIQSALDGLQVDLDVADANGQTRYYTYQGIGISYGTGADYGTADTAANQQKADRLAAGVREAPRADGPSRRIRESAARPGGRREGDPPAVGAQRSVPDQTQTPAFKRWFGKSQVVDENGDPLVVYHGTNDKFSAFDPRQSDGNFWFSSDRSKIESGESGAAGISRIMPVYLKAEKLAGWDEYDRLTIDQLISQGFDGVQLDDDYIVFEPEQIKSATGNRGTFNPADPNIMRSIPEGEDAAPAGADPVAFFHLARMGAFHYADGARTESEWTQRMEADLGPAADRYRGMLPDAFKASKAQADRVAKGPETVAEAVEAIGDQRRPRDVQRVVRAVVNEGARGDAVFAEAGRALDMEDADVRAAFIASESRTQTLTEAQAELKDLRRQLREAQRPDAETRYQDQRARDIQRRIGDLEERIAAGEFEKRVRVERELRAETQRLQVELEKTKERFHRYALEAEFQQRTPLGKLFGETLAGVNFARAVMTSLDLSAVLRQGGFITLARPGRLIKAFPGSIRAALSEDADIAARQDIESRPNAPLYRKYGLELTSIGGDALSRTEEAYASRWVDKLPSAAGGGLIRGSGRAYTAFLNRLRADSFDAMLAALARDGSKPTPEEGKAVANFINVATGRGDIAGKRPGEVLTATFFAPRLVASRFQLLAGQPLYGGSNRTRRMIASEYARFMIGTATMMALIAMARDPEDEGEFLELDPRSANFGKIRFGDAYVDPLAGLAQVTVFLSRVLSGETRTTAGALRPLRDSYRLTDAAPELGNGAALPKVGFGGRDVPDVVAAFLRSKLAPVPGAVLNSVAGESVIGKPTDPVDEAINLVTPMSVRDIVDHMENQGVARGTALTLMNLLGLGVQYRKPEAEERAEDANGIPGRFGIGTAEDATDGR